MAGEQSALLNLMAEFFDELAELPGLWSEEIGVYVLPKHQVEDLANRYAARAEALARHDAPRPEIGDDHA